MVTGISHLTLAVQDLDRSFLFYADLLGFIPLVRWRRGAYLVSGDFWLALVLDENTRSGPLAEETHVAFAVPAENFSDLEMSLRSCGATIWRDNRSEGSSLYFLDPDGHKLEIHVGTIASRMAALRRSPTADLEFFDDARQSTSPPTHGEVRRQFAEMRALHRDFPSMPLRRSDLDADPLAQFTEWLAHAESAEVGDPYAMTLATVTEDGVPSARTVILKDVDERGFIFTSHYEGPKGRELRANPRASIVFYWPATGRQVRSVGAVDRLPGEESARYFYERPRESQLALLAFPQSQTIPDRAALEYRFEQLIEEHDGREVPMPAWGGYVLRPSTVEFWQGHGNRLHDRFRYRRSEERPWTIERLAP